MKIDEKVTGDEDGRGVADVNSVDPHGQLVDVLTVDGDDAVLLQLDHLVEKT